MSSQELKDMNESKLDRLVSELEILQDFTESGVIGEKQSESGELIVQYFVS